MGFLFMVHHDWSVEGFLTQAAAGGDLTDKYSKSTETRDFRLRSDQRFPPEFNLCGATSVKTWSAGEFLVDCVSILVD